jgi:hypothetical protein
VSAGAQFSRAVAAFAVVPGLTGDAYAQALHVLAPVSAAADSTCNNIGTVMRQNPAAGTSVNSGLRGLVHHRPRTCP